MHVRNATGVANNMVSNKMKQTRKVSYDIEAVPFRFLKKGQPTVQGFAPMGPDGAPTEAQTYGKYLLVKELGRGGMGTVYLAEDTSLGRIVALKVLLPSFSADESFIQRFREEARSVAAVSHPNIVRINSLDYIDNQYVIDMEYLDGGSLGDLFHREVMTPPRLLHLLSGTIHALAACHQCGIVHRDVKPQNILVEQSGRVVLTDFGISTAYADHITKAIRRSGTCSFFVGTPRYAPPEAWDKGIATPSWDIYSLGMIIYECFTGKVLYDGSSPLEIARKMFIEPVPDIAEDLGALSPAFAGLLGDMLALEPDRRPKDGAALLARLAEVPEWQELGPMNEDTMTFTASEALKRVRRRKKREELKRQGYKVLVGMGIAAVFTVFAFQWWTLANRTAPVVIVQSDGVALAHTVPGAPNPAPSAEVFLGTAMPGSDTVNATTSWYLRDRTQPGRREGLVFTNDAIWGIEFRSNDADGDVHIEGFSAEYRLGAGQGFREARILGTGRRLGQESIAVTLAFQCVSTGEDWEWTGTLSAHDEIADEASFRQALQLADGPQAILFRELLPRKRQWAHHAVLGIYPRGVYSFHAPLVGGLPEAVADHRPWWNEAYYTAAGRVRPIGAFEGPDDALAWSVATEAGLHLAFTTPAEDNDALYLHLAVVPLLAYPVSASPVYQASIGPNGIESPQIEVNGIEQPWHCPWEGTLTHHKGRVVAEVFLPHEGMRGVGPLRAGKYVFVNAVFSKSADPGTTDVMARWGELPIEEVSSGMLLYLAESVQPTVADDET